MAEIEWKGAIWRATYGSLSVKELLTILKGFGPMEVLEFEKPDNFRGQISISISADGIKQITVYHLEVIGAKRVGSGRNAINWLRKIFKASLYVEDPGIIVVKNASEQSLLFWVKMFREGLIEGIESEPCRLDINMSEAEVLEVEKTIEGKLNASG